MTLNGFKSITVRERTYTKIEERARKENRSVSNLIDTLVMTNLKISSINIHHNDYDDLPTTNPQKD